MKGGDIFMVHLNPYLNFRGNTREVMEFYKSVFGGNLVVNTFKDFGMAHDPSEEQWIMHAQLDTDNGLVIQAADSPKNYEYNPGNNISISIHGDDDAVLRGYWEKLSEGATVTAPLEQAPWGDSFGMLTDKYGIQWMVNIAGKKA